jgi:hypothetical protein
MEPIEKDFKEKVDTYRLALLTKKTEIQAAKKKKLQESLVHYNELHEKNTKNQLLERKREENIRKREQERTQEEIERWQYLKALKNNT